MSSSSSSPSSNPHRSYPQKSSNRFQHQQRYVPKASKPDAKSVAPLTTSLRAPSSSSSSKEKTETIGGSFVNYLPQDEALASGFGPDVGGSDALESQGVVDVLNDELSRLLKMSPRDFWREVSRNASLHEFLDSYLQFRHRWYDFPPRGTKGMIAGVMVGEVELCHRVFMVLYRMSSNRDPGASASDCLSMKDHTALLQEKKLLDLPKLLDISAIYGHDNGELTKSLVTNAIKAQPNLLGNLSAVVPHFLSIVHTMHERCSASVEMLMSSGGHEGHRYEQLNQDFLEVMDFLNDAIVTLDAFAEAFRPAALHFSISFYMSYGNEELLVTLAKLHDSLLPSLQQGVTLSTRVVESQNSGGELQNVSLSLRMLSMRIVNLGWKLLDFCYLCDEPTEDTLLETTTKMFPAKVEDPSIRGDIILQTFKEINKEVIYQFQENTTNVTFLQNLEKNHKILDRIRSLRSSGWIFMDEDLFQYLVQIATPPYMQAWDKVPKAPSSSQSINMPMDEDAIIMESKISQIKDIFPDYGKGFLSACLDVYNHNPEEVIQRILEGTLHEDLLSLDTSLEQIPPPKSSSSSSHNTNDKGKGLLVTESALPASKDPIVSTRDEKVPPISSSSTSSLYGRFTRKSNEDTPASQTLDSRSAKESVRTAILAAELEYEDEYDDSFDDLGLSVVESAYEETENSNGSKSFDSGNSSSRWGSQKKPQFYVKDGKNYSYKVSGSVAVANANDAAVVNQAQKETIHGLGRGGNIPLGAVKKMMDTNEQESQSSGPSETFDRGGSNSRGRGGRRGGGGRNHYRKDRAMKKHFSGLGGN